MTWLPVPSAAVVSVATPEDESDTTPRSRFAVVSKKSTWPFGAIVPVDEVGRTVAVNVADWPRAVGEGEAVSTVVSRARPACGFVLNERSVALAMLNSLR